jgi:hypothetical protein
MHDDAPDRAIEPAGGAATADEFEPASHVSSPEVGVDETPTAEYVAMSVSQAREHRTPEGRDGESWPMPRPRASNGHTRATDG